MNAPLPKVTDNVCQTGKFTMRQWWVSVRGCGERLYVARSRSAAKYEAYSCSAFDHLTFAEFLKIVTVSRWTAVSPDFGAPITVLGKPAFFIDRNNAYVTFAYPDAKFTLHAHPHDVEPESFRPASYRSVEAA